MRNERDVNNVKLTGMNVINSNTINKYECYRCYMGGEDPFARPPWEYYQFIEEEPQKCQIHGKKKDGNGCPKGISMWYPHCFPRVIVDQERNDSLKYKIINSCLPLPPQFVVLEDQVYTVIINDIQVNYTHCILTPNGQYSEDDINNALTLLQTDDCEFEAIGDPKDVINFDDCEKAVGPLDVAQCALKCCVLDNNIDVNERCDAMILFAWLGSLDITIDELFSLSPWATEFILKCLKCYRNELPTNSNFVLDYGEAVDSLQWQIDKYSIL